MKCKRIEELELDKKILKEMLSMELVKNAELRAENEALTKAICERMGQELAEEIEHEGDIAKGVKAWILKAEYR